jgi:hypothetical protein
MPRLGEGLGNEFERVKILGAGEKILKGSVGEGRSPEFG